MGRGRGRTREVQNMLPDFMTGTGNDDSRWRHTDASYVMTRGNGGVVVGSLAVQVGDPPQLRT